MENGKIKCNLCNEEYSADACKSFTYGRLDVNICPTLGLYWYPRSTMDATYSRLFRQVVAVAAGQQYRVDYFNWADLAGNARGTLRLTNVNNGKYLDTANGLVYFNYDILHAADSSGLFMFPYNVLYCGYNREIEKLPITASIA